MRLEEIQKNRLTAENDVHEIATVDKTRTMENFIILRLLFIGGQNGWVFEVLALIDFENSLGHELIK